MKKSTSFNKCSLGALRPVHRSSPKSPSSTGKMTIQRETLEILVKQMRESGKDEVDCNLAGWINTDVNRDEFLTIQISPQASMPGGATFRTIFNVEDDDVEDEDDLA
jgi:hypothetical protein